METYKFTNEELEDNADIVKVAIVSAFVGEGLITKDQADEWCASHTVCIKKKSIWRTISDRWRKEEEFSSGQYCVVRHVVG